MQKEVLLNFDLFSVPEIELEINSSKCAAG
jgi:hypothetical protein